MILLEKTISFVDFMGILGAFATIITVPITLDQLKKLREKRENGDGNQLALIAGALENQTGLLTQRLALIVLPKLRIGKAICTAGGDLSIQLQNKGELALINDFSFSGLRLANMGTPLNLDNGEQVNISGKLIDDNTKYEISLVYTDAIGQKHKATIAGVGADAKILPDEIIVKSVAK